MKKKIQAPPKDEMSLARGIRTMTNGDLSSDKEREMFYFLQVFHPERGEQANRRLAREAKNE